MKGLTGGDVADARGTARRSLASKARPVARHRRQEAGVPMLFKPGDQRRCVPPSTPTFPISTDADHLGTVVMTDHAGANCSRGSSRRTWETVIFPFQRPRFESCRRSKRVLLLEACTGPLIIAGRINDIVSRPRRSDAREPMDVAGLAPPRGAGDSESMDAKNLFARTTGARSCFLRRPHVER